MRPSSKLCSMNAVGWHLDHPEKKLKLLWTSHRLRDPRSTPLSRKVKLLCWKLQDSKPLSRFSPNALPTSCRSPCESCFDFFMTAHVCLWSHKKEITWSLNSSRSKWAVTDSWSRRSLITLCPTDIDSWLTGLGNMSQFLSNRNRISSSILHIHVKYPEFFKARLFNHSRIWDDWW